MVSDLFERQDFSDLASAEFIFHIILEAEECCSEPLILEMEPLEEDDK